MQAVFKQKRELRNAVIKQKQSNCCLLKQEKEDNINQLKYDDSKKSR